MVYNRGIGDELKTDNKRINVAAKFSSLPGISRANCGKNLIGVPLLLPYQFLNYLNHMLNTSIKDGPNFARISISGMKKSCLKITLEVLSTKFCDSPPDFIFSIYYHQAIDVIESKICNPLPPKPKKKPPQNEFINIARILRDSDVVESLFLHHLLNFLCQW